MAHHWPLGIAAGLIAMAASLGIVQHNRAALAASTSVAPLSRSMASASANSSAGTTRALPANAVAPAPTAAPATAPVAPVAPGEAKTEVLAPRVPAWNANPAAAGVAPAAPVMPAVQAVPPEARTQVLAELRVALQGKLGVVPVDSAVGGYAMSVDGARVDVQPLPNWSVRIINNNAKVPEQETENFKVCLKVVAEMLGINMAKKAAEAANGKTYMTSECKMGNVSVIRDPAVGNSCTIAPLQRVVPAPLVPQANPNNPAALPQAKPAKPAGPPVAPPRQPDAEPVF